MKIALSITILLLFFKISQSNDTLGILTDSVDQKPEKLNFIELARKCGYEAEEHEVVTEDGYILTVHHIPGDGEAVYFQHGVIDSSDGFILREDKSTVVALAKKGYDIWLGNFRGNRYSRKHIYLSPNDKEFWDFSLDEYGYYDVSATIDYILLQTNKTKLAAIGHSEGTSAFFVLGSRRPEYNEKVKVLIALAPVAFLTNVKTPVDLVIAVSPLINDAALLLGKEELLNDQSALDQLLRLICTQLPLNYEVCGGTVFAFAGADPEEVNEDYLKMLTTYYPTGTSRRNLYHLAQISMSGRFQLYDYGIRNMEIYGAVTAPEYNLSKIKMRVELLVGENDKLATVKDVINLDNKLPNSALHVMARKQMNHIDFLHGEHMNEYLFPLIFEALEYKET